MHAGDTIVIFLASEIPRNVHARPRGNSMHVPWKFHGMCKVTATLPDDPAGSRLQNLVDPGAYQVAFGTTAIDNKKARGNVVLR